MRTHQSGFSIIKFLLIILILGGVSVTFFYIKTQGSRFFPISTIKIASHYHHISKNTLKKAIAPHIQENNFLLLNIYQLKKTLMTFPWIHTVTVRRVWPATLVINIEEQKPIALFNEKGVLNPQGEIFYPPPSTIPKQLPHVVASPSEFETVFAWYQKMSTSIQPYSLKIVFFELSPDSNLKVVLNNGISILVGRTDILPRWGRFVSAYPKLRQESLSMQKRIGQVDLRYLNGFAVRWTHKLIKPNNHKTEKK